MSQEDDLPRFEDSGQMEGVLQQDASESLASDHNDTHHTSKYSLDRHGASVHYSKTESLPPCKAVEANDSFSAKLAGFRMMDKVASEVNRNEQQQRQRMSSSQHFGSRISSQQDVRRDNTGSGYSTDNFSSFFFEEENARLRAEIEDLKHNNIRQDKSRQSELRQLRREVEEAKQENCRLSREVATLMCKVKVVQDEAEDKVSTLRNQLYSIRQKDKETRQRLKEELSTSSSNSEVLQLELFDSVELRKENARMKGQVEEMKSCLLAAREAIQQQQREHVGEISQADCCSDKEQIRELRLLCEQQRETVQKFKELYQESLCRIDELKGQQTSPYSYYESKEEAARHQSLSSKGTACHSATTSSTTYLDSSTTGESPLSTPSLQQAKESEDSQANPDGLLAKLRLGYLREQQLAEQVDRLLEEKSAAVKLVQMYKCSLKDVRRLFQTDVGAQ